MCESVAYWLHVFDNTKNKNRTQILLHPSQFCNHERFDNGIIYNMFEHLTKSHVDQIGNILRTESSATNKYRIAISELNQWRESHGAAMDYYFDVCSDITRDIKDKTIAQRLKRLPTILNKIQRYPEMNLSRMQDVAGVRVIVKDIRTVDNICKKLPTQGLRTRKDYIANPKPTGYRGQHLIFERNKMLVEVQLRTKLQHLWATSVETMDMYLGTSLKTSVAGDTYWQQFFALVASAFAYFEEQPVLPQHRDMNISEICKMLFKVADQYNLLEKIQTCALATVTVEHAKRFDAYYAVISLNIITRSAIIEYYQEEGYAKAVESYERLERDSMHKNNVLVAVSDIKKLQTAYPNYFMDLREFVDKIKVMLAIYNKNR